MFETIKASATDVTKGILDNHLKCFATRNLAGTLADYSDASVFFTPEGTLNGRDAIKPFFEKLLQEFSKPGASFDMKHVSVDGEHAYITWSAETEDNIYELGTDTFVIRNGKIVVQSFAGKLTPKK